MCLQKQTNKYKNFNNNKLLQMAFYELQKSKFRIFFETHEKIFYFNIWSSEYNFLYDTISW